MITVLIVDDQPSVRHGLSMRLEVEPDMLIVGEAADGEAALSLAVELQPHVVLMDVKMPRMDGIQATAALRTLSPRSAVVILSLYTDPATQARALSAGAAAFLEKRSIGSTLLTVIRQVTIVRESEE